MSGVRREDKIKKEFVRSNKDVASIVDKMREKKLRWFWACDEAKGKKAGRLIMKMNFEGKREEKDQIIKYD